MKTLLERLKEKYDFVSADNVSAEYLTLEELGKVIDLLCKESGKVIWKYECVSHGDDNRQHYIGLEDEK